MGQAQFAKNVVNKVIAYAFTGGVIIALVLGVIVAWLPPTILPYLTSLLILAGIVVGSFNIAPAEAKDYVLFVTALVVVTSLGGDVLSKVQVIGPYLEAVLRSVLAFILPSVLVVGVKAILNLAQN